MKTIICWTKVMKDYRRFSCGKSESLKGGRSGDLRMAPQRQKHVKSFKTKYE